MGFAVVYEGRWKGRDVALKTMFDPRIDEKLKQDYMDELFVMSRLDHPNIVSLYGACTKPPKLCMVLELCNSSLFDILHNSNTILNEKKTCAMMLQIAKGLEYLHGQNPGIIHRDIKSQNILVTDDFRMKICDFGLVNTCTTTAGTPSYMAPELLSNSLFSRKVDTFAFAVLMWESFTRSVPFSGWDPRDIREYILRGERLRLPLSGCPKPCLKLIERCWHVETSKRPEFKNICLALKRIHSSLREISHTEEIGCDSFDELSLSVQLKK